MDDLSGSRVAWILERTVFLDDRVQMLCTAQFHIDRLHDGHQVEVILHEGSAL